MIPSPVAIHHRPALSSRSLLRLTALSWCLLATSCSGRSVVPPEGGETGGYGARSQPLLLQDDPGIDPLTAGRPPILTPSTLKTRVLVINYDNSLHCQEDCRRDYMALCHQQCDGQPSPKACLLECAEEQQVWCDKYYCDDKGYLPLSNQLKALLEAGSVEHGYQTPHPPFQNAQFELSFVHRSGTTPKLEKRADYAKIVAENNLCERVAAGKVDEVWVWSDGWGKMDEGMMVGPGAQDDVFNTVGEPVFIPECTRPFHVMGFNYTREADQALHSMGHRFESTIAHFVDGKTIWDEQPGDVFYEFDGNGYLNCHYNAAGSYVCDPAGEANVGNVHYPPNTLKGVEVEGYQYSSTTGVWSDFRDWNPQHSGTHGLINCQQWGCTHEGYLSQWIQNFPGRCLAQPMTKPSGARMPDWWQLIYRNRLDAAAYEPLERLAPPEDIKLTTQSSMTGRTTVSLAWPPVPLADGYQVEWCLGECCTNFEPLTVVHDPFFSYKALGAALHHRMRIRTVNACLEQGKPSDVVSTTPAEFCDGGGGAGGAGGSAGSGGAGSQGGASGAGGGAGEPPGGSTTGDPHVTTFDGLLYDQQGAGEFVLTRGTDLEVQVRQQPLSVTAAVSFNTAVATRVGLHRVGIYAQRPQPLWIDGQPVASTTFSATWPEGTVTRQASVYEISWSDGTRLKAFAGQSHLDLKLWAAPSRAGTLRGLMGNFDGSPQNEFLDRQGVTLAQPLSFLDLKHTFLHGWRITQAESLFDYEAGQSTETFTDLQFPLQHTSAEALPPSVREQAAQACTAAGVTSPTLLPSCILDVGLTGDSSYTSSSLLAAPPVVQLGLITNDFEGQNASGWSIPTIASTPGTPQHPSTRFLGPFDNQTVTFTRTDLPPHTQVKIEFDLFLMDSWDGGPNTSGALDEQWLFGLGNQPPLLHTSFSNIHEPNRHQSFPNSYGEGLNEAQTGALETNTLGYSFFGDSVYRISRTVSHTDPTLQLWFAGRWVQGPGDETWGLDNVSISFQ